MPTVLEKRINPAIKRLPPGLTYRAAAKSLGMPYMLCRKQLLKVGYIAKDGRGNSVARRQALLREFAGVDWRKSNIGLALELGKSREWIRQVRNIIGAPPVESRGRKRIK